MTRGVPPRESYPGLAGLLLLSAFLSCFAGHTAAQAQRPLPGDLFDQTSNEQTTKSLAPIRQKPTLTTRELAKRVQRSLVLIVTQDREGNDVALGSGFFIKPNLVATNLHVMKRASQRSEERRVGKECRSR